MLQVVAHLNPVTYAMDAMRGALLNGSDILSLGRPCCFCLPSRRPAALFRSDFLVVASPHKSHRHLTHR